MRRRLGHQGGAAQQDRLIKNRLRSMLSASKNSYQAAKFKVVGDEETVRGLFNPVTHNENYDTKMISVEKEKGFKPGTYFYWENTGTYWIVFLQDLTELAYFRGECRPCNFKVKWISGDRERVETLISVIGPSGIRLSHSKAGDVSTDMPNASLQMLVQNNPENKAFFKRYQIFFINNTPYRIEQVVDDLSMPGVIRMTAIEHYANLVEDDIEDNTRNVWNVQPVIPEYETEFGIEGPSIIKPKSETIFEGVMSGGRWLVLEAEGNLSFPAKIVAEDSVSVTIIWDSLRSGSFTLGYEMPNGKLFQRAVIVESLF